VHGIPGFEVEGQAPIALEPLGEHDAITIARDAYGLDVIRATRFDTERDDTFRIETLDDDFVLKIAHPADSLRELDLETQALAFAAREDPTLPLQRVIPDQAGTISPPLPQFGGRRVRLLSWLAGTPLLETRPTDAQRFELGATLGQLTAALAGFEHPAAWRSFAWDAAQFDSLAPLAATLQEPAVDEIVERFRRVVIPRLNEVPKQVIHNDFNPGNVIVDPTGEPYVTGIIDFGDTVHTARICDLAVGVAYQIFPLGQTWDDAAPFIAGYESVVPLESAERDILPDLVAVRFAQRRVINHWLNRDTANGSEFDGNVSALESMLELLSKGTL
jgi:hypothetical protein